jgi:hypothetical protein
MNPILRLVIGMAIGGGIGYGYHFAMKCAGST